MPIPRVSFAFSAVFFLATSAFLVGPGVVAGQTVLYSLGGPSGANPVASLVFDNSGDLFGTTTAGGNHNKGVVFELVPQGGGVWAEKTRYHFGDYSTDGTVPKSALIFDNAGNLYGTTSSGGTNGVGTVFELTAATGAGSKWKETILYNFGASVTDGAAPASKLTFDSAGNLYGTTVGGGANGLGTVYRLVPNGTGGWNEAILHSFTGGSEGSGPVAGVIFNASGNIYGVATSGGTFGGGTAYELIASQGLRAKNLHNFGGFSDGKDPVGDLIMDASGNLYGTTVYGGGHDNPTHNQGGIVFRLSPNGSVAWTETVLYEFCDSSICTNINPESGVIMDTVGNLYGTTYGRAGDGAVYKLSPSATPPWTETTIGILMYSRTDINDVAGDAVGGLVADSSGNLYGATSAGGVASNQGAVYEVLQ